MAWFRRKKSAADDVIAVMYDVIQTASDKWTLFSNTIIYKQEVPLVDRVTAFMVPFEEGLRANVPALRNPPDGLILMLVLKGIEKSGTHTRQEIETAFGLRLPD